MSRRQREQWAEQLAAFRDSLPKIFCCGLPRTGTMSVSIALYHFGMPCTHWIPRTKCSVYPYLVTGELRHLQRTADRLRAWSGLPWMCVDDLLTLYPDAWWILTTRPMDQWAKSWEVHSKNVRGILRDTCRSKIATLGRERVFGKVFPSIEEAAERYEAHNARCRQLPFAKFVELDVSQGHPWETLVRFLGVPFPHTNQGHAMQIAGKDR